MYEQVVPKMNKRPSILEQFLAGCEQGAGQDPFSSAGSISTSGKRSPDIFADRAKQPRLLEDNSFSQFSSYSLHNFDLEASLIDSESFDPTSPESGVDLSVDSNSPPPVDTFSRTTMEGILSCLNKSQPPGAAIQILEEPEQNYRPRYESEGHRAPMKGRFNKSSFPTVQIVNVPRHTTGTVQVSLVEVESDEVFPFCQLSGEIEKSVGGSSDLSVKFCDLRIQRIINNDANRKTLKGKSNQGKLLFYAKLKTVEGDMILKSCSQPILLEPAQGRGTLSACVPSQAREGEDIVILGHKLAGPCVVEFSARINDQDWTAPAELSKDKFPPAKNAILAKVPKLPRNCPRNGPLQVTVTVYTGRDRTESANTQQFTYITTCAEMAKPEVVSAQCVLPLMREGQQLLEAPFHPMYTGDSNNGFPLTSIPSLPPPPQQQQQQQQQQPGSPQSDGWNDPISANRIHTASKDQDVFQFPMYSHPSIKQLPATASVQPFPVTSSVQAFSATSSMQPFVATSSMQPFATTSSMESFAVTSSMQQLPPSPPRSQYSVTSSMQPFPASPPLQTFPATSTMQQLPASPSVPKCTATSSMQQLSAMAHGPCSPFYPQSGFNSPRPI